MATIDDKILAIRNAKAGKDVRSTIADGIQEINSEVEDTTSKQNILQTQFNDEIANQTAGSPENAETMAAHTSGVTGEHFNNIGLRLDDHDTQLADNTNQINTNKNNIATHTSQIAGLASGAPKAVSLVANMTDTTKNYVYTGSENGYTAGHWYYYNGSVWSDGGVYQSTGIADSSIKPKSTTFLNRASKNLLGLSDVSPISLPAGITYSVADGIITLNGTATTQVDIILPIEAPIIASSASPVRYSVVTDAINTQISLGTNAAATNNLPWGAAPAGNYRTINTDITITSMVLRVLNGVTFNNMKIKCQIESGTVTTPYQNYYTYEQDQVHINPFINKIRCIDVTKMGYVSDGTSATIGSISSDVNWEYQKVVLKKGEKITFTVSTVKGALPLAKCNSDWSFLSAIISVTNTGYVTNTYDYTAENDTEYLIISNVSLNLPLELYRYKISDDEIRNTGLFGKKIAFIGDSYVANNTEAIEKTWHYKLADKYNMTYINKGINGDGLIGIRNDLTPVKDRILTDVPTDCDYVVLIGGENDYNISLPINDFNTGLDTLFLNYLQGVYVANGAKVCVFVPWRRGNATLDTYIDALITKCKQYGIPVFDTINAGLYPLSDNYRNTYYQTSTDTSHLNERGHNYFYNKAEKFMLSL